MQPRERALAQLLESVSRPVDLDGIENPDFPEVVSALVLGSGWQVRHYTPSVREGGDPHEGDERVDERSSAEVAGPSRVGCEVVDAG